VERAEGARMDTSPGGGRNEEAVMRFIERCALTLTEAGVPRMPARVFVALLVSDEGRRTAAELAEMLKVSPAAVSNAVRYLQQVRMAVREREPGERRDHYRLYDDTWYEAVTQREEMLRRWQEDMRNGIEAVGADTPAGRRLEETRRFYAFLLEEMPQLMERWRKLRSESSANEGV
jgi:DNA-binding transcriptional regulator GbsR (MarR family)